MYSPSEKMIPSAPTKRKLNNDQKNDNDDDGGVSEQEQPERKRSKKTTDQMESSLSRALLNVSKTLIPESKFDHSLNKAIGEDEELKLLGIVSYDNVVYEKNVINQVKKNLDDITEQNTDQNEEGLNVQDNSESNGVEELKDLEELEDFEFSDKNFVAATNLIDQDEESSNQTGFKEEDESFSHLSSENQEMAVEDSEEHFANDVDRIIEAPETFFLSSPRKSIKSLKSHSYRDLKREIFDDGDSRLYRLRLESLDLIPEDQEKLFKVNDEGLRLPQRIWDKLYDHQRESLRWLWKLHLNFCGGIIGDEMGLGKTIQVITFFVGLNFSPCDQIGELYRRRGPMLLVCPATVMFQWVCEFHKWWPRFRVAVLHQTGSYRGSKRDSLIRDIFNANGILVTSYNAVSAYHKQLVRLNWHYVVLDEGHKIRNPNSQIAHHCKLFQTPHRLILSGTPIQNDLRELWSLMDFIYPGKLGSLQSFMNNVARPIRQGGYANASEHEIRLSYRCTVMLRDTIKPFLLRRTKDDTQVNLQLPSKNEQVLFCKLTEKQRKLYLDYINSGIITELHKGRATIFKALVNIRKICNHPFLMKRTDYEDDEIYSRQFFHESSKMVVVNALLKLWHKQNHKVLIFTQGRKMLNLLEEWADRKQYQYFRMDGETPIARRQELIKRFNEDSEHFLFLLTTRVGGVGISLTGATRAIIFDPDWNPCTDMQARERCWRIGQSRDVIIYRLLTAGTVEEKIYHRQIFKQYLTNRVLHDPMHRRFFKINDLYELFTLNDGTSDTANLYLEDSKVKLKKPKFQRMKNRKKPETSNSSMILSTESSKSLPKIPKKPKVPNETKTNENLVDWSQVKIELSEDKKQELRDRVKKILNNTFGTTNQDSSQSTCEKEETSKTKHEKARTKINYQISEKSGLGGALKVEVISDKKTKDSRSGIKFEGKRIKYLIKKERFHDEQENETLIKKREITQRASKKNEDYLLAKLMGGSIDSVLQHDRVENVKLPDYHYIEKEAQDFAKKALRDLEEECRYKRLNPATRAFDQSSVSSIENTQSDNSLFIADSSSSSGALSSGNIIEMLKMKFNYNCSQSSSLSGSTKAGGTKNSLPSGKHLENLDLMHEMHDFLSERGLVSTDDIIERFKPRIRPEQSAIMKALLRHMAEKRDGTDSSSARRKKFFWALKPEFDIQ